MTEEAPWIGVFRRGETVGEFRIDGVLGEGGMGVVYRANHAAFHRDVAIKVLPRARSASRASRERFEHEAEALKQLNHRNIISIIDKGSKDDNNYLVMELLPGRDLEEVLRRGPMSPDEAIDITLQIADALQYAHDAGIVHRDLKPANVLMDDLGVPKVADFGIAQSMIRAEGDQITTDEQVGTAEYAAPEQLTDASQVDQRADIYALGAVLYEMLTGLPPVGRLKRVHLVAKGVHRKVDQVIRKAMGPEKEDRFGSAELFAKALRAAHGIPEEEDEETKPSTRWRNILLTLGGPLAACLIVWGALALIGRSRAKSSGRKPGPGSRVPKPKAKRPTRKGPSAPTVPVEPPRTATPSNPPAASAQPRTPDATKPPPKPQDPLAGPRSDLAKQRFAGVVHALSGARFAGNPEAQRLLAQAEKGERARLVALAGKSVADKRWDAASGHVRAAAKLRPGPDLEALDKEIKEGKRAWLVQEAERTMAQDPDKAIHCLMAAHKLRPDNDLRRLFARVRHTKKLADEKVKAEKTYTTRIDQGDKAAERKDHKMARQWYRMAQQIRDTDDVRRKLSSLPPQ